MKKAVEKYIDKNFGLTCLNYMKGQIFYRLGIADHGSGATHSRNTLGDSVRYIRTVVDDYFQYGGLSGQSLTTCDVLEIGPGDNLGVALMLVAKGAKTVTCIDRFKPASDSSKNLAIYRELINGSSHEERRVMEAVMQISDDRVSFDESRIKFVCGEAIENAHGRFGSNAFDLIVSRAVLEHVFDLPKAWEVMAKTLRPNGGMLHKVDFRNHNKFSQFHPLYFLTINEFLWSLTTSPDPTLNRERLPTYIKLANRFFNEHTVYITRVLQNEELLPHKLRISLGDGFSEEDRLKVETIKPKLISRFNNFSLEDLLVSGIFIRCSNPKLDGVGNG